MPDFETDEYRGCWLPSRKLDGRHGLLVVLKRSWRVEAEEGICVPASENDPIRVTAVLSDPMRPATSDVRYPGDLAPQKDLVDVLVSAEACAPGGKALRSFEVGLNIADVVERRLRVHGSRAARFKPPKRRTRGADGGRPVPEPPVFEEPEPVASLLLSYRHAYGGEAVMVLDEETRAALSAAAEGDSGASTPLTDPVVAYPANPAGRGFCISDAEEAVEGLALPQIEDLEAPLEPPALVRDYTQMELAGLNAPAGFAPLPVSWFPRASYAGVMPWDLPKAEAARDRAADNLAEREDMEAEWVASVREQSIPVMGASWFQDAHPKLQVARVLGDERVDLTNLTRHGALSFELPGRHPWVRVSATGVEGAVAMTLDTVHFDLLDEQNLRVHLVWRGFVPLPSADAVANAADAVVQVRDLPQAAWLVRRQELLEPQGDDDSSSSSSGATVEIERVVRDDRDV